MNARNLWSQVLTVAGGVGMAVGAMDPLEGSVLILPGSGLVALGAYVGQAGRRAIAYRVWAFILVAIGIGAMWGLSAVGGFGGTTGRSNWWGLIFVPYLVGWIMGVSGPGSPRWLSWLGIAVGLFYLAMAAGPLRQEGLQHWRFIAIIGGMGIAVLAGCIYRLSRRGKAGGMAATGDSGLGG